MLRHDFTKKENKTNYLLSNISSHKSSKYFFMAILLIFIILAGLILKPFLTYIFLGIILAYSFYPIYKRILNKLNKPILSSSLLILLIILLIIIPLIFIMMHLVIQASSVTNIIKDDSFSRISGYINQHLDTNFNLASFLESLIKEFQVYLAKSAFNFLSSLTNLVIGLFIMFFLMFYLFMDGEKFMNYLKKIIPLSHNQMNALIVETKKVTSAVIYGQIFAAIIQGVLAGIGYLLFGISNPIFWGFLTAILALLPFVGSAFIWLPMSLYLLYQGHYISAIGLLIYSALLVSNIDNVLKPKLIGSKAKIHPTIVLIGVFGGISVFGFIGIIAGPLILAILLVLIKLFHEKN
jgi:predicted PurR-regulated permease PerM